MFQGLKLLTRVPRSCDQSVRHIISWAWEITSIYKPRFKWLVGSVLALLLFLSQKNQYFKFSTTLKPSRK